MKIICNHNECTGCYACSSICAKSAITMTFNDEGFVYPVINESICVDCGMCEKVCPNNNIVEKWKTTQPYLAWNNNYVIRRLSSSGGIFSAIAEEIITRRGVVCGAAYDNEMTVKHLIIDKIEDLSLLRGSKYTQSLVGDVFTKVKKILNNDRWVYFVGTPCQVAGLKNFLKKDYNKLITSDLVCHGVPSGELLKEQIKCIEKRIGKQIKDFNFRAKHRMGQTQDVLLSFSGQENIRCLISKFKNFEILPYCYGFRNNSIIRENCYQCKYTSIERVGDISLADFWNVKEWFPGVKRSPGCSLILVNSERGREIINDLRGNITLLETTIAAAISKHAQLKYPLSRPATRDLYKSYKDFDNYCKTFLKMPFNMKIKRHLINFVKIITLFKYRY